jgi:hypothetical protein
MSHFDFVPWKSNRKGFFFFYLGGTPPPSGACRRGFRRLEWLDLMKPFVGEAKWSHLAFIRRKSELMTFWLIWAPGALWTPEGVRRGRARLAPFTLLISGSISIMIWSFVKIAQEKFSYVNRGVSCGTLTHLDLRIPKNGPGFGVGPPDLATLEVGKVPDPQVPPGVKYKQVPILLKFAAR